MNSAKPVKIAIIDLYNGEANQGMRCIQDQIYELDCKYEEIPIQYDIFESRLKGKLPGSNYDIYISSGGPGSPFDDEGSMWEKEYFRLFHNLWDYNQTQTGNRKYGFFICHSFQIMARVFDLGRIIKRKNKSFGIVPFDLTNEGRADEIFSDLHDPFWGADFRWYQVIEQNKRSFSDLDAKVLTKEKIWDESNIEPAMMAIRLSNEFLGTQFHPEADPASMYYHFRKEEAKEQVVAAYGEEQYYAMIKELEKPDSISHTRKTILPGFLHRAVEELRPESARVIV